MRDPSRRAYRSSQAASLCATVRSVPSPAAGGGGDERGASEEAGGAAMELQASALANGRVGRWSAVGSLRARPADYKSHKAMRLGTPPIGHRQPGKDPTPRVATNSAHTAPGKPSIDIYLIQSFLIHTVDGPPVPLRAWGRGRGPGQTVTR